MLKSRIYVYGDVQKAGGAYVVKSEWFLDRHASFVSNRALYRAHWFAFGSDDWGAVLSGYQSQFNYFIIASPEVFAVLDVIQSLPDTVRVVEPDHHFGLFTALRDGLPLGEAFSTLFDGGIEPFGVKSVIGSLDQQVQTLTHTFGGFPSPTTFPRFVDLVDFSRLDSVFYETRPHYTLGHLSRGGIRVPGFYLDVSAFDASTVSGMACL